MKKIFSFLFVIGLLTIISCSTIEQNITSFSINGVTATINDISITVALPAGTNVTSLTPTITVSEGATISPASGATVDFTAPVIYTVTAANKATRQYVVMVTVSASDPSVTNLCVSAIDPSSKGFQSGDGSTDKPYVICNAHQLNLINDLAPTASYMLNKSYILGVDIDMSGIEFSPIGDRNIVPNRGFTGVFDGNNKRITDLTINYTTGTGAGFIGYLSTAGLVKNLGLVNINITTTNDIAGGLVGLGNRATILNSYVTGNVSGSVFVGGLIGSQQDSTISGCYTAGTVNGTDNVGGLVGLFDDNSEISNSYSASNVMASGDYVGGLAGDGRGSTTSCLASGNIGAAGHVGGLLGSNYGTVHGCHASGTVTGSSDSIGGLIGSSAGTVEYSYAVGSVRGTLGSSSVGGLIGYNNAEVRSSYSTATVRGINNVGGLVGYNSGTSLIYNSFATGSVTGTDGVGGLIGDNESSVTSSYSIGTVLGTTNFGGLIGYENGTAGNSYWDTETSGQSDPLITDPTALGETTATMKDPLSTIYSSWDFERIWSFNEEECFSAPVPPFLPPYCCLRPFVDF